jgi:Zn-dependent peptidase ImmA (M78 family)
LSDTGELVVYRRQIVKPYRDPEWQANTFSSALLMPAQMVRLLASKEHRLLLPGTMTEEFGVSFQAAEVRLKVLEI